MKEILRFSLIRYMLATRMLHIKKDVNLCRLTSFQPREIIAL